LFVGPKAPSGKKTIVAIEKSILRRDTLTLAWRGVRAV
jgi:hypothetical protein